MKRNQSSVTAQGIALARTIESSKPASERICYDPFARYFVGPVFYLFKFFVDIGYAEWRGPGVMGFLAARARYIDDYLQACLDQGLEQLVILGAGYDSRAYRFEQLKQRRVFEVDHPATQQAKVEKIKTILGGLPSRVTYVPIDFNIESLEKRLAESGYDECRNTLFIWEGVTEYLTPEAIDSTLAFVAHHSGAGSSIIFDYIYTSALQGTRKRSEVGSMQRYRRFTGEGLTFGIAEGTVEAFLQQRGFCQVRNVDHVYFKQAYFTGPNEKRRVASGYAIAAATVCRQAT